MIALMIIVIAVGIMMIVMGQWWGIFQIVLAAFSISMRIVRLIKQGKKS